MKLILAQDQRFTKIRALNAVSQFQASKFDAAIDTFNELDVNPAKVVALYPESVAGRLSTPHESWISLFGGPKPVTDDSSSLSSSDTDKEKDKLSQGKSATDLIDSLASGASGSIRDRLRTGLGVFMPAGHKDDDGASIISSQKMAPTGCHDRSSSSVLVSDFYSSRYR